MYLAERWLGFGTIALAVALAPLALLEGGHHHHHHHHHHHYSPPVDFGPHGCSDGPTHVIPPTVDPTPPPGDPYLSVFEHAAPMLAHCVQDQSTIQLLVTIAPDGHVAQVSPRPDEPTPASRCLAKVIRPLRFPPPGETVVVRVPFTGR
jgi:hypothetical protein